MIVIIPSNRQINLRLFSPLIDSGARFIIVDDSEGSIRVDHPQFSAYNWGDRRRILGDLDVGFPRRNGACRDFGFHVAWKNSDRGEVIVALDDDCEVYDPGFGARVEEVLSDAPRVVVTTEGDHLNILDLYEDTPKPLFPRGFPYSRRPGYRGLTVGKEERRKVTFSLGLWRGIFDVNAIDKIQGPAFEHPQARLRFGSAVIEESKLVSVCSMNMHFRRELIPAVYQLPMHVEVMPGWNVDRYGDIWGGFILKTLMDLRGEAMAVGEPMINHLKEGNHLRNIWQEHVCHLVNDEFVGMLSEIRETITPAGYPQMMEAVCDGFRERAGGASPLLKRYLPHLCTAMDAWNRSLK